jgi:hypothetical protein
MWNSDERLLITEIAVDMSRRLDQILSHPNVDKPPSMPADCVHGMYVSQFENPLEYLRHLEAVDDVVAGGMFLYRLHSTDNLRAHLSSMAAPVGFELDRLLAFWLTLACDYGPKAGQIQWIRESFDPPADSADAVHALVRTGYMERNGAQVAWTNRITEAMCQSVLWTRDGQPWRPILAAEIEARALAVWLELSPENKRKLIEDAQRLPEVAFVFLGDGYGGITDLKTLRVLWVVAQHVKTNPIPPE